MYPGVRVETLMPKLTYRQLRQLQWMRMNCDLCGVYHQSGQRTWDGCKQIGCCHNHRKREKVRHPCSYPVAKPDASQCALDDHMTRSRCFSDRVSASKIGAP